MNDDVRRTATRAALAAAEHNLQFAVASLHAAQHEAHPERAQAMREMAQVAATCSIANALSVLAVWAAAQPLPPILADPHPDLPGRNMEG